MKNKKLTVTGEFERKVIFVGKFAKDFGLGKGVIYKDTIKVTNRTKTLVGWTLLNLNDELIKSLVRIEMKQINRKEE